MGDLTSINERHHKAVEVIWKKAYRLHDLSRAAHTMGFSSLGDELEAMADTLNTQCSKLQDLGGEIVSYVVKGSEEHSRNMLNAVLAGAELEKKNKEKRR